MACTGTSGNTWHTTPYYDYISGNNSAPIRAKTGTGADLPVIESVEAVGPAAIKITWGARTQVNGRRVTHYEVQRETNPWEMVAEVMGTRYVDTGMAAGASPRYRVRAVNDFDQKGPWSQPSGGRPGAPTNFTATVAGATQIRLSWSAPAGVTVTGYHLDVSTDGGDTWSYLPAGQTRTALPATATSHTHTDSTLAPGATRHYRLRAVGTDAGTSFTSEWEETSATVPYPKPGAPKEFAASGVSDAQANLSWMAPDTVTGVTVTGYELGVSTDGGNTWNTVAGTPTLSGTTYTLSHTDASLGADDIRQYRARTLGTVGSGSEQVTVRSDWTFAAATRDYPTPGAPRNFTTRAINQSQVNLSWSEPEAVAGVTLSGYHLEFSTDGNTWAWLPIGQTRTALGATKTSHEHNDDTLSPGALRQYRLRAVGTDAQNAVFESGWVFANAATEAVGPPQDLTATADGIGRIDLTWEQPGFGADRVTGYRMDYTPASPEDWQTLEHGYRTSPRRFEHSGLSPGQQYCYRVAATYAGGTGPFAARACATTEGAPTDLPGKPENLRVKSTGGNYVELEWDKPIVGGAAEYYEWRSDIHDATRVTPETATSVKIGGLSASEQYWFEVRAGNSYGPGQWARSIRVQLNRSGGAIEASPRELEVEKGGSGSFNVSLKRSSDWPLMVYLHSIGPECLTEGLAYQQFKILLPSNLRPSKEFWEDSWWGLPEDRFALPWNTGVNVRIDASGCQGGETTVIEPMFNSVPFSYLEGLSLWDWLNLDEEEWRDKWGIDPLDGVSGPSVKVMAVDGS